MQVEHELFDCVEIMLFGIPLICHMAWNTKKTPYRVFMLWVHDNCFSCSRQWFV